MITHADAFGLKLFFGSIALFVLMSPLVIWLSGAFVIINAIVAPILLLVLMGYDPVAIQAADDADTVARDPSAKAGAGFDKFVFNQDGIKFSVARADIIAESHASKVLHFEQARPGNDDDIRTILVDRLTNMPFFLHTVRIGKYNSKYQNEPEATGHIKTARAIWNKADMMQLVADIDPTKIGDIEFDDFLYIDNIDKDVDVVKNSHEAMAYA